MNSENSRLQYLVNQYLYDRCNPGEQEELWQSIREAGGEEALHEELQQCWQAAAGGSEIPSQGWEHTYGQIILQAGEVARSQAVVRMRRRIVRWVAAASVVLLLGAGSYFWLFDTSQPEGPTVSAANVRDIQPPATNRATITLADGRMVSIDSITSGTLASQSAVTIAKNADGKIAYTGTSGELMYNTLTNPRGSKVIDMLLADGSHVWLNAGSSLTYPVAFVGNERKVSVTGEAYFEVAHDAAKPFYVSKGDMTVQVLGTHFNVNAYDDEDDIKVTLLEGAVNVNNIQIKPGQQAQVGSVVKVLDNVDVEQVMAWKNGEFQFGERAGIKEIMRQLARWYNIGVQYKDTIPVHFGGTISRNVNISQVLQMLEKTGGVKFSLEGNTVIVMR